MEIISLNCNKLKIITQYIYHITTTFIGGGLISFFHLKGGLIREGAYLRGGLFERGLI